MRALVVCMLAACDPIWGAHVDVRRPDNLPLEDATVAVACADDGSSWRARHMAIRTTRDGHAQLGGIGSSFPVGCDVFVAKPGYQTHRIRYRDLCPNGPEGCARVFSFDLVLEPE